MSGINELPVARMMLSLVLAMGLRIVLLPYPWSVLNPDWVALVLLFWVMATKGEIGVVSAWGVGLIVDALTSSQLGQHALSYSMLAYLSGRWHRPILLHPMLQQILSVLGLLLVNQLFLLWTQHAHLEGDERLYYWLSPLSGALLWPLVSLLAPARTSQVKHP